MNPEFHASTQLILQHLRLAEATYVSGEQLSRALGMSRTAIWKHIRLLRAAGIEIDSQPRRGYRISFEPDYLEPELFKDSAIPAWHLVQQTDSTQTIAHRLAADQALHGTVVLAEQQTAGRGRMQRPWHSPYARGIWLSMILRPQISIQWSPQLTLLTAVAVCEALRAQTGLEIGIKWPNDLLLGECKLAGILLETVSEANQIRYVVAGIGINVNQVSADFPPELRTTATSLRMFDCHPRRRTPLILATAERLLALLEEYENTGFSPILARWNRYNRTLLRRVRVLGARQQVIEGTALEVDEYGALLIRLDDGQLVKNYSGDLQLIPVSAHDLSR